jgi:hypothetical protein
MAEPSLSKHLFVVLGIALAGRIRPPIGVGRLRPAAEWVSSKGFPEETNRRDNTEEDQGKDYVGRCKREYFGESYPQAAWMLKGGREKRSQQEKQAAYDQNDWCNNREPASVKPPAAQGAEDCTDHQSELAFLSKTSPLCHKPPVCRRRGGNVSSRKLKALYHLVPIGAFRPPFFGCPPVGEPPTTARASPATDDSSGKPAP